MIKISDFNYQLPKKLIAQIPVEPRDNARLMIINRKTGEFSHQIFKSIIDYLDANDILVINETKVFPARLYGQKRGGALTEILLIKPLGHDQWECLGKNLKIGTTIDFSKNIYGKITSKSDVEGTAVILFNVPEKRSLDTLINIEGQTPIPPYIQSPLTEKELRQRYQTVYANQRGSVAAPTAGLHFTSELLARLKKKGVKIERVTLHVGPGTFGTLYPHHLETQKLHEEKYEVETETVKRLITAKKAGKRIVAVGTTSCRTLETIFKQFDTNLTKGKDHIRGATSLFIMPPYQFNFVDALITNFHLPESSLLMLVTAFVSFPNTKTSYTNFASSSVGLGYQNAITHEYRFFSFGDAMFIHS